MNLEKLLSGSLRLLFLGAFGLLALMVFKVVADLRGQPVLTQYSAARLLELANVLLIFAITVLLRQIRDQLQAQRPRA